MTNEEIIKSWRIGRTKFQIANDYMKDNNKKAKTKEEKIDKNRSLSIVEPIIFEYETKDWK